ncbi:hypothetical protein IWW47_004150, partial [Coemansia sp. RSA 2052]
MRELSRAMCDTALYSSSQREHLVSLYVNGDVSTVPLRADFYDIGALVDRGGQAEAKGGTLTSIAATYTKRTTGTTVLDASLDMALEFLGMCIKPSLLYLSERHETWAANLIELDSSSDDAQDLGNLPLREAETWLTPNTRQIPFMEFLLSRATNASTVAWNIPHQPRVRHGVPLLKDVWDEELGQPSMGASVELSANAGQGQHEAQSGDTQKTHGVGALSHRQEVSSSSSSSSDNTHKEKKKKQQQRRRGYYVAPGHIGQQRQVVITNGAGQVMTDYVVVRASTDASLQEYARASPVHDDSIIGSAKVAATRPSLPGAAGNGGLAAMAHRRRMDTNVNDDSDDGEGIVRQGPRQGSTLVRDDGGTDSGQSQRDEHVGGAPRLHLHLPSRDVHRRREYEGRLADFAELFLYQGGQVPQLVPHPTTLIMLHLYSSSAVYGCEEYTPREQRMVKRNVVAVRVGGGCTVWEKAIHATNAGASALLVDGADADSEHNGQHESQSAGMEGRTSGSLLCACDDKEH